MKGAVPPVISASPGSTALRSTTSRSPSSISPVATSDDSTWDRSSWLPGPATRMRRAMSSARAVEMRRAERSESAPVIRRSNSSGSGRRPPSRCTARPAATTSSVVKPPRSMGPARARPRSSGVAAVPATDESDTARAAASRAVTTSATGDRPSPAISATSTSWGALFTFTGALASDSTRLCPSPWGPARPSTSCSRQWSPQSTARSTRFHSVRPSTSVRRTTVPGP